MRRTVVAALALLALAARALDEPKKPPGTPAEQFRALVREYQAGMNDFMKEYRAAKNDEERQKLVKEKYPGDKLAPRFLELAEKHPKDPVALDALSWVVSNSQNFAKDGPRARALAALVRDHAASDKLVPLCSRLGGSFDKASLDTLRAILAKSPDAKVKGVACMALGDALGSRAQLAGTVKNDPETAKQYEAFVGKEVLEEVRKDSEEALHREARKYFERVQKEFPDVKDARGRRLGEVVKGKLLGPGVPAPEVEGEDVDGKKFKLADYRGKVVLLDFWGNW